MGGRQGGGRGRGGWLHFKRSASVQVSPAWPESANPKIAADRLGRGPSLCSVENSSAATTVTRIHTPRVSTRSVERLSSPAQMCPVSLQAHLTLGLPAIADTLRDVESMNALYVWFFTQPVLDEGACQLLARSSSSLPSFLVRGLFDQGLCFCVCQSVCAPQHKRSKV